MHTAAKNFSQKFAASFMATKVAACRCGSHPCRPLKGSSGSSGRKQRTGIRGPTSGHDGVGRGESV